MGTKTAVKPKWIAVILEPGLPIVEKLDESGNASIRFETPQFVKQVIVSDEPPPGSVMAQAAKAKGLLHSTDTTQKPR